MSANGSLDDNWRAWLLENLERGCSRVELVQILRRHGFTLGSIRECMGEAFPAEAVGGGTQAPLPVLHPPAGLRRIETGELELFTWEGFLAEPECDALVTLINQHLRPSTVTIEGTEKTFRTSRTCDLSLLRDARVTAVDEKICRAMGISLALSEGIQAQRYDPGQQFKAHTDFFEPDTPEYARFAADRGNRTWTFMVYLNEGMVGGSTRFFAIDRAFQPRKGMAVIWNNLHADGMPNRSTLHSGEPVTTGYKVIITKWFRERGAAAEPPGN